MNQQYRVSVPASTSNLGPGYDVLGLALDLRLEVQATLADAWTVTNLGYGADLLPRDETHYAVAAYLEFCAKFNYEPRPMALSITNEIPLPGGLGGSAAAVVAGMALACLLHRGEIDRDVIFQCAAISEGHPDNASPAVFGGLQICGKKDGVYFTETGPISPQLKLVLVAPPAQANTAAMRRVMPDSWPPEVLSFSKQLLASVMRGLASADPVDLRCCAEDRLHQPYRFNVQPLSNKVFQIMNALPELAGAFLSGSGATVAGWLIAGHDPLPALQKALGTASIEASVHVVNIDHQGLIVAQNAAHS